MRNSLSECSNKHPSEFSPQHLVWFCFCYLDNCRSRNLEHRLWPIWKHTVLPFVISSGFSLPNNSFWEFAWPLGLLSLPQILWFVIYKGLLECHPLKLSGAQLLIYKMGVNYANQPSCRVLSLVLALTELLSSSTPTNACFLRILTLFIKITSLIQQICI